jgi:ankyrin repeat protein
MGCSNSVVPTPINNDTVVALTPSVMPIEDGHTADTSGLQFREASSQDATSKLMAATKQGDLEIVHRLLQTLNEEVVAKQTKSITNIANHINNNSSGDGEVHTDTSTGTACTEVYNTGPMATHSVNTKGMWNSTPLIIATQYSHYTISLSLMNEYKAHIDVSHCNEKGASALLHACINQDGNTTTTSKQDHTSSSNIDGKSKCSYLDIVRTIIELNPRAASNTIATKTAIYNQIADVTSRWCPLSAVCANGNVEVYELFNAIKATGTASFMYSSISHHDTDADDTSSTSIFHFGKDVGLQVTWGARKAAIVNKLTPLMVACSYGSFTLIEHLFPVERDKNGYSCINDIINAKDEDGCNVFHHAARGQQPVSTLNALFDVTETVNITQNANVYMGLDLWGYTPLHYLCHTCCASVGSKGSSNDEAHVQVANRLLTNAIGCNTGIITSTDLCKNLCNQATAAVCTKKSLVGGVLMSYKPGTTPLHIAVARKSQSMVKWLLSNGAHPNAHDNDGITPIALAKKAARGHETHLTKMLSKAIDNSIPYVEPVIPAANDPATYATPASKTSIAIIPEEPFRENIPTTIRAQALELEDFDATNISPIGTNDSVNDNKKTDSPRPAETAEPEDAAEHKRIHIEQP